ncbi:hypothetical protein SAMN05216474_0902 [Lishizhenia tianjinensis]|uniref:Lipoprotein n=1 Tax=Lishizhenia tianjinensis TaxID=477690 RepID=A0A1I6YH85_9FLAO|nr:hypothetical protein [Lishizhenia tianjinensis]SFT49886.1 hypothetical protein SAMN05216474_0902 [Lishizhenia tianjinensis]
MKNIFVLAGIALSVITFGCSKNDDIIESEYYTAEEQVTMNTRANTTLKFQNNTEDGGDHIEGVTVGCMFFTGDECTYSNVDYGCRGELLSIDCMDFVHELLTKVEVGDDASDQNVVLANLDAFNGLCPDKMIEGVVAGTVRMNIVALSSKPEGSAYIEFEDNNSLELIMATQIEFK